LNNFEDKELYSRILSGDEGAFRTLFYKYFKVLAGIAARILSDTNTAEDVAQDVFVAFWRKRASLQINEAIFPYLRQMVIHEALGAKRKLSMRAALDGEVEQPLTVQSDGEDLVIENEMRNEIENAIDALPDQCRKAFRMSRFDELSYREIAHDMDISIKTVENHIGRALRHLRVSLQQYLNIFL